MKPEYRSFAHAADDKETDLNAHVSRRAYDDATAASLWDSDDDDYEEEGSAEAADVGGGDHPPSAVAAGASAGATTSSLKRQLAAMEYVGAVVKETLRLFPSIPMLSRRVPQGGAEGLTAVGAAAGEFELGGYAVPRHCELVVAPYVMHRLPGIWGADAAEFRPARWGRGPD